jgi:hypothetical protein
VDAAPVVIAPVDAGVRAHRDAGGATGAQGTVLVTVYTRPGDALVYIDNLQRGPSGVHLVLRAGIKQKIECRIGSYRGSVIWDGVRESIMCTAVRVGMCVPGLLNPLDHCEEGR